MSKRKWTHEQDKAAHAYFRNLEEEKSKQIKELEAENKRLRKFIEYVASIDCAVVSDPDNENPLSMGELQAAAEKALKGE